MPSLASIVLLLAPYIIGAVARPYNYFQITAITACNRQSKLECWQLSSPIFVSNTSTEDIAGGQFQSLGPVEGSTYGVVPPRFESGNHVDRVEFLAILSGLAHITIANSTDEVWIGPGYEDFILTTDTSNISDIGHDVTFPTDQPTTSLQVQPAGGVVPDHIVLHQGPCIVGAQAAQGGWSKRRR
ncbi:MAG: hypothetical protein M1826_005279 [Phylliscum demangeonii]|nr:MAG: hypothetical protein M1826_005279 [Phylliscum demangeonii]